MQKAKKNLQKLDLYKDKSNLLKGLEEELQERIQKKKKLNETEEKKQELE